MTALLTTKEVAALYKVQPSTIQDRCEKGTMQPPPVLERPYRFSANQVEQVLAGTWTKPAVSNRRQYFARGKRTKFAVVNS